MDKIAKKQHVILPFNDRPVSTLEGRLKKYSSEELHLHESHQVLYFERGISLLLDESKKQPLFNTMSAFIPAGCPHRSVVLGREVRYKSMYIDRDLLVEYPENIRVFDMSELGIALLKRIDMPLFGISNGDQPDTLQNDCLQLFLKVLKEDVANRSSLARLPVARRAQNETVIRYIEEKYTESIQLQDFANLLPYSVRHISRMFKEDLKITLFEYLKIYRILQASIQLDTTDTTITEIAYGCGYSSISCFFKDFSQIFSLTPRQFRLRCTS